MTNGLTRHRQIINLQYFNSCWGKVQIYPGDVLDWCPVILLQWLGLPLGTPIPPLFPTHSTARRNYHHCKHSSRITIRYSKNNKTRTQYYYVVASLPFELAVSVLDLLIKSKGSLWAISSVGSHLPFSIKMQCSCFIFFI